MTIPITLTLPRHTPVERYDTIVVGAGQAGLALGQQLAAHDEDFLILDGSARVGDVWRNRWDSLRLFTPAAYSGLPGMPFPARPSHIPDKDEVADYLERYAERFDLPVRLGERVVSLGWSGDAFTLRTEARWYEARHVVVATGPFQTPRIPEVARDLAPGIHQVHSSQYRNPLTLPPGDVLVVGAGNSGAQIALELARERRVWLAGRDTGHLPRRVLGRDVYDWIWPVMSRAEPQGFFGRRLKARMRHGDPLVGIPEATITAAGVQRVGRLTAAAHGKPVCDGVALDARVVIWCTGFRPDYAWIQLPIFDGDGVPRHERGAVPAAPGLHFLGLRFQRHATSALIGGVGRDATLLAARIAEGSRERAEHATGGVRPS